MCLKIWSTSNYNIVGSVPSTLEVRSMEVSSDLIYLGCKGGIVEVWCKKKLYKPAQMERSFVWLQRYQFFMSTYKSIQTFYCQTVLFVQVSCSTIACIQNINYQQVYQSFNKLCWIAGMRIRLILTPYLPICKCCTETWLIRAEYIFFDQQCYTSFFHFLEILIFCLSVCLCCNCIYQQQTWRIYITHRFVSSSFLLITMPI